MAAVPKLMYRGTPPNTTAVSLTVPAGYRWVLTNVVLQNSTAGAVTGTIVIASVPIVVAALAAGQQYVLDCRQVLNAGDVMTAQASVGTVLSFHLSGVEQGI